MPTRRAKQKVLTCRSLQQGKQKQHGVRHVETFPVRISHRESFVAFRWSVRRALSSVTASADLGCGRGFETEGFDLLVTFGLLC